MLGVMASKPRPKSKVTPKKGMVRAPQQRSARGARKKKEDPGIRILKMIWAIGPEHFHGLPE